MAKGGQKKIFQFLYKSSHRWIKTHLWDTFNNTINSIWTRLDEICLRIIWDMIYKRNTKRWVNFKIIAMTGWCVSQCTCWCWWSNECILEINCRWQIRQVTSIQIRFGWLSTVYRPAVIDGQKWVYPLISQPTLEYAHFAISPLWSTGQLQALRKKSKRIWKKSKKICGQSADYRNWESNWVHEIQQTNILLAKIELANASSVYTEAASGGYEWAPNNKSAHSLPYIASCAHHVCLALFAATCCLESLARYHICNTLLNLPVLYQVGIVGPTTLCLLKYS